MTISREDPRFWDVRLLERRIRHGLLNKKDVEKHLRTLPDVTDKAAPAAPDEADDSDAE